MRRMLVVGIAVATFVLAAPVAAKADGWTCYYCGPAWLSSGEGHPSEYDGCNNFWTSNWLWKSDTALGTIAFIDTEGGWVVSRQTYEVNMVYGVDPANWVKKLYGKNSSGVGYSGEMRGWIWYVYTGCS